MAHKKDVIIKQKRKMHTDRCDNISGQECRANGSRKDIKIQGFVRRRNVEHEMCEHTSNNWNPGLVTRFQKESGSHTRKNIQHI
jgi:hypothetical protein